MFGYFTTAVFEINKMNIKQNVFTFVDHIAHIIELLGPLSSQFALSGRKSKQYFNRKGKVKYLRSRRGGGGLCPISFSLLAIFSFNRIHFEYIPNLSRVAQENTRAALKIF